MDHQFDSTLGEHQIVFPTFLPHRSTSRIVALGVLRRETPHGGREVHSRCNRHQLRNWPYFLLCFFLCFLPSLHHPHTHRRTQRRCTHQRSVSWVLRVKFLVLCFVLLRTTCVLIQCFGWWWWSWLLMRRRIWPRRMQTKKFSFDTDTIPTRVSCSRWHHEDSRQQLHSQECTDHVETHECNDLWLR